MTNVNFLFDWAKVDDLFDNWNIKFKTAEMNGSSQLFQIVFSSYAPTNIEDCLTSSGTLNTDVTVQTTKDCALKWENDTIRLGADVTWTIGDNNYPLKAIFIRHKETGYVMGYSINTHSFTVTNQLKLLKDTMFWTISGGV